MPECGLFLNPGKWLNHYEGARLRSRLLFSAGPQVWGLGSLILTGRRRTLVRCSAGQPRQHL